MNEVSMPDKLLLNLTLHSHNSRADKSLRLIFVTQELPPEEFGLLYSWLHQYLHVLIKNAEITEDDIQELDQHPTDVTRFTTQRSPSQRLRGTLYKYWKELGLNTDFQSWYEQWVNETIVALNEHISAR